MSTEVPNPESKLSPTFPLVGITIVSRALTIAFPGVSVQEIWGDAANTTRTGKALHLDNFIDDSLSDPTTGLQRVYTNGTRALFDLARPLGKLSPND
jgi:hypothetical protein